MQQLFDILPRVAESDYTVLIEGETGTGKELFARALHSLSPRRQKPFVAVNCSTLPDTLLESELFGYKAGAFTDAKQDKPGRFARAQGGTLFLNEIGDTSPTVQVRLLRVLQDKTYEPVGGVKTIEADVRVVTATNRNLSELVDQGVSGVRRQGSTTHQRWRGYRHEGITSWCRRGKRTARLRPRSNVL